METNILKVIDESQDLIRNIDGLTGSDAFEEVIKVFFTLNYDIGDDINTVDVLREIYVNRVYQVYDFFIGDNINLKDITITELISLFNKVDLKSEDIKGRLFEGYLGRVFTSGLGQFFTPREIVSFMTGYLKNNGFIGENDVILDPACGSSGILIDAHENNQKVIGYDINQRLIRVSKMNMVINGISNYELNNKSFLEDDKVSNIDVVITNPPFGVKEKQEKVLNKYKFGVNKKSVDLEILFIEKIINVLKPGGVCALVLPDGVFNNVSLKSLREHLLEKCEMIASVDLPENVFKSTGTGCETGILIFRKKNKKSEGDKSFMAYKVDYVGYETQTKFAKKIDKNDLLSILNNHEEYEKKFEVSNLVDSKRIDGKFYFTKNKYIGLLPLNLYEKSGTNISKVYSDNDIIRYVQYSDVDPVFGLIKSYTEFIKSEAPSRAKIVVRTNDILIPKLKQSSDKITLVTKEYDGCVVTNGFYVLKSKDVRNTKFLFALLRKNEIQEQITNYSSGTIMPSIDDEYFEDIRYFQFTNDEKNEVEIKINNVFNLIESAKEIIDNL